METLKRHQWLRRHVVWAITRQNRFSGVCSSLFDGVKKVTSKKGQKIVVQVGYLPSTPCSTDCHQNWHGLSRRGRNQSCQISNRSVQWFQSPRWPKIAISHWLATSPHYRATLWWFSSHSACSECLLARTQACRRFRHWSIASSMTLCCISAHTLIRRRFKSFTFWTFVR